MANRPSDGGKLSPPQVKSPPVIAETKVAPPTAVVQLSTPRHFPVVGIVASAGGLTAFNQFFKALPSESGAAFVVVPHLDAKHKSLMVELLSRQTTMPVVEAADGQAIEANRVYVIPPNRIITIEQGTLRLDELPAPAGSQTAIDIFLRSLATDLGERAIGVVLSGTGSHGTLGVREIKRCGGMAMVQAPESAEFDQMPRSAIETGLVDFVLPPEQMAETLVNYVQQPYVSQDRKVAIPSETVVKELDEILKLVREHTKYDFRSYRKNMLLRRTERRMGLMQIADMSEYVQVLRDSAVEVQSLCMDFLIGVTAFFREPAAFSILERRVIPALVQKHSSETPLRIWVPGCATGEEAYSISILLFEALMAAGKSLDFQIFASDINDASIAFARRGLYPASVASDISASRLAKFFVKVDDVHYKVTKQLRESIVFSKQNLISDAPFSKIDLISCRNLLIYLEPEVQQKLIPLFHFALNENGFLTLGPAETLGRELSLFDSISKEWRVYSRAGPVKSSATISTSIGSLPKRTIPQSPPSSPPRKSYKELAESLVLNDYSPATALINRQHEILNVTGPLVEFLEFPSGEMSKNLLAMARPGLRSKLRTACHQANQSQTEVTVYARVKRTDVYSHCAVTVRPVLEPTQSAGLQLVLFRDQSRPLSDKVDRPPEKSGDQHTAEEIPLIDLLENELKATREELQNNLEQMGSANEELQSSNEELQSSKEELQSLNEELNTVNCQLLEKVAELDQFNTEISNLMASTEIATLFLDNRLRVKRFTRPAINLLDCSPANIGRLLSDLESPLLDPEMIAACKQVLDHHQHIENEITTSDGKCYLRRILPFSIVDNLATGIVVTLIDMTELKRSKAKQREKDARYREVFEHATSGIFIANWDGVLEECNPAFCQFLGYSDVELRGIQFLSLVHPDDQESSHQRLVELQAGDRLPFDIENRYLRKDGQIVWVRQFTSVLMDISGKPVHVVALVTDMTPQKMAAEELQASEKLTRLGAERLRAILDTASDAIVTFDNLGTIDSVNQATESIFGYTSSEAVGMNFRSLLSPSPIGGNSDFVQSLLATEQAHSAGVSNEVTCQKNDGSKFPAELSVSRVDHLELFTGVLRDISQRRAMQQHILEIAADEQRRIGLELHDGTQQELTGLTLYANAILETLGNATRLQANMISDKESTWQFNDSDYERLKTCTQIMTQRLSETNRHVRDLAHGIMPVQVDAEGLSSALSELANATTSENVQCRFTCTGHFGALQNATATHLYRIAQEAVNNTLRHGAANQITISLVQDQQKITLQVDDDGIGFDSANLTHRASIGSGMGLRTMEYRSSLIGGSLEINNKTDGGTQVQCSISPETHHNG